VAITNRGIPIGRIVPIGKHLDERLAAMQHAGQAGWSGRRLVSMASVAKVAKVTTVRGKTRRRCQHNHNCARFGPGSSTGLRRAGTTFQLRDRIDFTPRAFA
jgi:antitoxin (DNA-binding transcriptional repressor) of toxin-antitoxin stability system